MKVSTWVQVFAKGRGGTGRERGEEGGGAERGGGVGGGGREGKWS